MHRDAKKDFLRGGGVKINRCVGLKNSYRNIEKERRVEQKELKLN